MRTESEPPFSPKASGQKLPRLCLHTHLGQGPRQGRRPQQADVLSGHSTPPPLGALTLAGVSTYISYSHLAFAGTAPGTCRTSASALAGLRRWPGTPVPQRHSAASSCSRRPSPQPEPAAGRPPLCGHLSPGQAVHGRGARFPCASPEIGWSEPGPERPWEEGWELGSEGLAGVLAGRGGLGASRGLGAEQENPDFSCLMFGGLLCSVVPLGPKWFSLLLEVRKVESQKAAKGRGPACGGRVRMLQAPGWSAGLLAS